MWGRNPILWTSHFCQNLYSQGPNFCQVPATCPSKLFSCEMFRVRSHCNQTKINQPLIPLISSYNFLPTLFQETIPVMKKLEDDASVEEALVMLHLQVKFGWLFCKIVLIPVNRCSWEVSRRRELRIVSAAPEQPLTHAAHVMHEAEHESMATECDEVLYSISSMKHQLTFFILCHWRYSKSEYRKAVVYSTVLHRTFPSFAARMSHCLCLATIFSMAWYEIGM